MDLRFAAAKAPGQPWKHGKQTIKTMWGELAWQLGGKKTFARTSNQRQ
jgi:predicted AAA+ superfamily ATPase